MNILCSSRAVGAVFVLSDVCFAAKHTFRVFISPHRTPSPNMRRSDNTHRNTYRILRIFRPFFLGTRIVFSEEPDASWRLSGRLRRCRLVIFEEGSARLLAAHSASNDLPVTSARTLPELCASTSASASLSFSHSTHHSDSIPSPYSAASFFAPYLVSACSRGG